MAISVAVRVCAVLCAVATYYFWRWLGISEPVAIIGALVIWGHPSNGR